jgi:hypothetical protein
MRYRLTADDILTVQAFQNPPSMPCSDSPATEQKQSVSSVKSNISVVLVKRSAVGYERLSLEANQ